VLGLRWAVAIWADVVADELKTLWEDETFFKLRDNQYTQQIFSWHSM
jgi:hypothetical protein